MVKIAIVLLDYPKLSEPFIDSFISHLKGKHDIYLISDFNGKIKNDSKIRKIPYLKFKGTGLFKKIMIAFKIVFYLKRFNTLYKLNVPYKQLISDAGLLTLSNIDILHFPFANLSFRREHYAKVLNAKMSISFRGSDINVYPVYHKLSYSRILEYSDFIHCNSVELRNKLMIYNKQCLNKVKIIHSAIREDYKIDSKDLIANIQNRDYSKETFVTVGRLHWVKDYALTFETLGLLKILGYQFDYKIIGDGPEKEHLVFLADFYNITENVHFLGARNSNEIKEELQMSTMYLQTSLAEGFSNSCLEAQSQGLLCVVTDVSGMSACIEDNVTGYILKERNSEYMKECILKLMNLETVERNKTELYASERVFSKFSQQIQKQAWINFFNS